MFLLRYFCSIGAISSNEFQTSIQLFPLGSQLCTDGCWLPSLQFVVFLCGPGPYSLNGYRVRVYRQDSATQWFTGIITHHDLFSRNMVVMNDQVSMHTQTRTRTHVYMHTNTQSHTHIHTHTYPHTNTHAHTVDAGSIEVYKIWLSSALFCSCLYESRIEPTIPLIHYLHKISN